MVTSEDFYKASRDVLPEDLEAWARVHVAIHLLADRYGAGVLDWPFDQATAMLKVMEVEAKIQKEAQASK